MFFILLSYIFWGSSEAILNALFHESESMIFKPFFINLNFDFKVLPQKCLKPCVNGVIKFHFFFLNVFSKIPAGVRVRMSIYPYMDICECRCLASHYPTASPAFYWQLLIATDSSWKLLTATDSDSYWQLLIATESYWQLVITTESDWRLLTATDRYWQLLTVTDSYLHLMTVTDSYWQLLKMTDIYWQLLIATDS